MDTRTPVLDYAVGKTAGRPPHLLRLTPYLATLVAVGAWLKSRQYHRYGQLRDDQEALALLMGLSGALFLGSVALLVWHRGYTGKRRLIAVLLCAAVLAFNALAYWNACTATVGEKDRLF